MGRKTSAKTLLMQKYGVRFDEREGRWITAIEVIEKRFGIRFDAEEGRWVTTEHDHKVHINGQGVPDKGNPYVVAVMKGEDPKQVKTQKSSRESAKATIEKHRTKLSDMRTQLKPIIDSIPEWRREIARYQGYADDYEANVKKYQKAVEREEAKRDEALAQEGTSADEIEKAIVEKQRESQEIEKYFEDRGRSVYTFWDAEATDEEKKMRERHRDLNGELADLTRKVTPWGLEFARDRLQDAQSNKERMEKKIEELKKNDPTTQISESVRSEYNTAAKERNEAVLRAYPTPQDCDTTASVADYMRAKGYFRSETDDELDSDLKISIDSMGVTKARALAEHMDKLAEDYPWMVGKLNGVSCIEKDPSNYGGFSPSTMSVNFNSLRYMDVIGDIEESYSRTVESGFHPHGTDYTSIVDHEMTHAMEELLNRMPGTKTRAADLVMRRVAKRLGKGASAEEQQDIREMVCEYAGRNGGVYRAWDGKIKVNSKYGKNTEWLAEAMAEARCSESPSEIALLVRDEFEKLMREKGLEMK